MQHLSNRRIVGVTMHSNAKSKLKQYSFLVPLKVAQQSRTSAKKTCVRTEEYASASGTPTAATVPLVTEARTANKVNARSYGQLEVGGGCGVVFGLWRLGRRKGFPSDYNSCQTNCSDRKSSSW